MVATELASCKLQSPAEKAALRNEVLGILKSVKPAKSNITPEERKALKEIQKNEDLMLLPADKGRAVVLLDTKEYEEKVKAMLSDPKTYRVLDHGPGPYLKI